jgi:hypothetical protein
MAWKRKQVATRWDDIRHRGHISHTPTPICINWQRPLCWLRGREKEKGIKTKMRVKLAAKLLIIAWTLMKKKESFNPELLKIKK